MKNLIVLSLIVLMTACQSEQEKIAIKSLEQQLESLRYDLERTEGAMEHWRNLALNEEDNTLSLMYHQKYNESSDENEQVRLLITETQVQLAELK